VSPSLSNTPQTSPISLKPPPSHEKIFYIIGKKIKFQEEKIHKLNFLRTFRY
jgi:hypothetical protein